MKESNSDASRLERLLKDYKNRKFHKGLNYISCDGVIIKNSVVRQDGLRVVKYDVLVDGRGLVLSESMRERVRDIYNRVFYCEPDDTPLRERLLGVVFYLSICAVLSGVVYVANKWQDDTPDVKTKIEKQHIWQNSPVGVFVIKNFRRSK